MILTISEIYSDAIREDTSIISENLDIELKVSEFILPLRGVRCVHYW
jgi:hypothetical protein